MSRFFRWGCLEYFGMPWLGEQWLDDTLRLGPPSVQDRSTLHGPRAVLVCAMVEAVSVGDSAHVFEKELKEIAAFLSVVMATNVERTYQRRTWTWEADQGGKTISGVRQLGYIEPHAPSAMPARNTCPAVPLYAVPRPGRDGTETEVMLPADVAALWAKYRSLGSNQQRKFLQVAAKWQEALLFWQERDTLSFTLMVVACEALKPLGSEYRDFKAHDVVKALLGAKAAEPLQQDWFRAHLVRSEHLHLGEVRGSELRLRTFSDFYDPTFDEARRALFKVTNNAITEWLRRGGEVELPVTRQLATWRRLLKRFVRQNAVALIAAAVVTGALGDGSWAASRLGMSRSRDR
jgi:hypothetical protein